MNYNKLLHGTAAQVQEELDSGPDPTASELAAGLSNALKKIKLLRETLVEMSYGENPHIPEV